ncbi:sensor histidine kinase [Chryseomicrobium palamuruense]|uniref:histidine kinase n=1 Tax=Chryseomicrobium palamuruense TaxID=682973 RepID=A0ABV8US81_9BACL
MTKLFVREHLLTILFPIVIAGMSCLLFWLDGYGSVNTMLYVFIVTVVLTAVLHFYLYLRKYKYYRRITTPPKAMEDMLEKLYASPEQSAEQHYMKQLYKLYQQEVQSLYSAQKRHLQFMNGWVHQMKTPIAVIELMIQEQDRIDSQSVSEEMERLKRALEAVLMNARLDTFEEDLRIERVHLSDMVKAIVNENKRLFIRNQLYPRVEIDETVEVTTDRKWVQFIITQFITNAVKYSFTPQSSIWITSERTPGRISLTVKDEGIGIPSSDIKRVTRAFFTGENGRKTGESTGMGLYIANEVCERLGHKLEIESEQQVGTSVTIHFIEEQEGES